MLVLAGKAGEKIRVGDVVLTIVEVAGKRVKLGIDAPKDMVITREATTP